MRRPRARGNGSQCRPAGPIGSSFAPAGASANYFKPKGTYDCTAYSAITHSYGYVDTYKFGKKHTYKFGLMSPTSSKFQGSAKKGRYKVKGQKIVPTSGALKKRASAY